MTRTRPGRLYRALDGWPRPLVNVTAPSLGTLTDSDISSITITRGSGGIKHEPATVEIALADYVPPIADETLSVTLTADTAYMLFHRTGAGTGETPARFAGRIGRQSVKDTGTRQTSTLFGTSWSVQAARTDTERWIGTGIATGSAAVSLLTPPHLAGKITASILGTFDPLSRNLEGSYSELFPKVTSDIGNYVSERRDGSVVVQSWTERKKRADAAPSTMIPLTRSAALAPTEWEQPNEVRGAEYRVSLTTTSGAVYVAVIAPNGQISGTRPVVDVDWTHIVNETDQWKYAYAISSQGLQLFYRMPSIRFDLLHLLTHPHVGMRRQAGQLLALESGDPVTLSADWPVPIRGVFLADGITERITGNSWEIELQLVPYRWNFGDWSPAVPARMWDSARNQWNTETRTWNAA